MHLFYYYNTFDNNVESLEIIATRNKFTYAVKVLFEVMNDPI